MFARNFPGDHNIEEAMYRAKFAAEEVPATAADTLNGPPAVLLAVTAGDVAMPEVCGQRRQFSRDIAAGAIPLDERARRKGVTTIL